MCGLSAAAMPKLHEYFFLAQGSWVSPSFIAEILDGLCLALQEAAPESEKPPVLCWKNGPKAARESECKTACVAGLFVNHDNLNLPESLNCTWVIMFGMHQNLKRQSFFHGFASLPT